MIPSRIRVFWWKITSLFEAIYLVMRHGVEGVEEIVNRRLKEDKERFLKLKEERRKTNG